MSELVWQIINLISAGMNPWHVLAELIRILIYVLFELMTILEEEK